MLQSSERVGPYGPYDISQIGPLTNCGFHQGILQGLAQFSLVAISARKVVPTNFPGSIYLPLYSRIHRIGYVISLKGPDDLVRWAMKLDS